VRGCTTTTAKVRVALAVPETPIAVTVWVWAELTDIVAAPVATRWPSVVAATGSAVPSTGALSGVIAPLPGRLVHVNVSGMLSAAPPPRLPG
jgi:hypothetical protein